jgi:hypothetical protein
MGGLGGGAAGGPRGRHLRERLRPYFGRSLHLLMKRSRAPFAILSVKGSASSSPSLPFVVCAAFRTVECS